MLKRLIAETKSAGYCAKRLIRILLSLLFLFLISSCATTPPMQPASTWLSILPDQSSLYICIPEQEEIKSLITESLPLLDLSIPEMSSILNKTMEVYAAISIRENDTPLFSIALIGRYSSCWIGFGLSMSNQWKKDPETNTYWKHTKTGIMLAQPDPYLLLITNRDINEILYSHKHPQKVEIPEKVEGSLEKNTCTLFFPHFGKEMIPEEIPINTKKLPIKELVLSIDADEDLYSMLLSFNLMEIKKALLFTTSFKTFIIWLMRRAKIDKFTQRIHVDTKEEFARAVMTDFTQPEMIRILSVLIPEKDSLSGGKD